ncbi:unnamed protein product [Laminaria digitata]
MGGTVLYTQCIAFPSVVSACNTKYRTTVGKENHRVSRFRVLFRLHSSFSSRHHRQSRCNSLPGRPPHHFCLLNDHCLSRRRHRSRLSAVSPTAMFSYSQVDWFSQILFGPYIMGFPILP